MKKKKYKSKINQRIFRSIRRLSLVVFGLVLVIGVRQVPETSSFFSDSSSVDGSSASAGYWVEPDVEVTNPGSGHWQVGSVHNIAWTAESADSSATAGMDIDIDYDCGSGWANIIEDTSNDGSHPWTVPEEISDNCKIRVTATDSHGLVGVDQADGLEISHMVVLNEFMPDPAVGDEWVELYNYGTEPIDVDNWEIRDELGQARVIDSAHTDTGNTVIDPSSSRFLVVENYDSFYLNNSGDTVNLYDDNDNRIDFYEYSSDEVATGKTIARDPDGVGAWVDPIPTPGKKNDPSNDPDEMKEYYEDACFDDGEPICEKKFLKALGLWDDYIESLESKKEDKKEEEKEDVGDSAHDSKNTKKTVPEINPKPIKPEAGVLGEGSGDDDSTTEGEKGNANGEKSDNSELPQAVGTQDDSQSGEVKGEGEGEQKGTEPEGEKNGENDNPDKKTEGIKPEQKKPKEKPENPEKKEPEEKKPADAKEEVKEPEENPEDDAKKDEAGKKEDEPEEKSDKKKEEVKKKEEASNPKSENSNKKKKKEDKKDK